MNRDQKKWRVNFSIGPKSIYFDLCFPYAKLLPITLPPKDGKQLCTECVIEYRDGTMRGLFPAPVIEAITDWIREKMVEDTAWADALHQQTEAVNREFFDYAEEVRRMDLSSLTNSELGNVAVQLRAYLGDAHTRGWATTWFVDSDGEKFSVYLRDTLKHYLENAGIADPARRADAFVLLTTPARRGMLQDEQNEFLTLVRRIEQTPAREVFRQFNIASEIYCHLPKEIQQLLREHYEKWHWVPYGYIGPAYALEHYVEEAQKALVSGVNVQELLAHEEKRLEKVAREQARIVAELALPEGVQHMFAIARDIIWLKDYRKLCQFHGCYVLHLVMGQVAKRLNLTLKQAAHFLDNEIIPTLEKGEADHDLINKRLQHSVAHITPEKVAYFYGGDADRFMSRIEIEQTSPDTSGEMRGSCACPGAVEGEVKIINTVEDMPKMREGDIMVAHTTFPALVPAMKKAAAIVTEDGGITCHAAIVAREFRIPCIVGIKHILDMVRDGDRLRVDATNAVAKKMKKITIQDWFLFGEWFNVYWFHSCYLDGCAYMIAEKVGQGLSQIVAELEDGVQRFYFSRKEWSDIGKKYLDDIIQNPQKLESLLNEIRQASDALMNFSDTLSALDIATFSLQKNIELLREYHERHHRLWSLGMVPNVLELENSFLTDYLKAWLESKRLDADEQMRVFQVLTTPRQLSAAQREERDMLALVQRSATEANIAAHTKKYHWLQFGWTGPSLDQAYFQAVYDGLRKDTDAQKRIQMLIAEQDQLEQKKNDMAQSWQIPADMVRLFRALEELLFMKTHRMDALFESFAAVQPLLKALAKSQHLSLNQVYCLYQTWFIEMIKTDSVDEHRINDIGKYSIRYFDGEKIHLLVGQEARLFMEPINAKLPKVEKVNELKGECAYPGKVTGIVKVVNLAREMSKFEDGDILVSNVTDPTLLPIMKKAAAFVTNQGGLTCHAAIVARELHVPCVIGTKAATHVFHDGDMIEVDATNGMVKKIT